MVKHLKSYLSLALVVTCVIGLLVFNQSKPAKSLAPPTTKTITTKAPAKNPDKLQAPVQKQANGITSSSFALPEPWDSMIGKLPPEDRQLAKQATKSIGIHREPDGAYILLQVDGKKIHDNPSLKYLQEKGINDKSDVVEVVGR